MLKNYIITFENQENKKIKQDTFTCNSEKECIRDFKECYRHSVYKIISIKEK